MTSRDFCYWLQGYFEILNSTGNRDTNEGALSHGQVECIKKHLAMVFAHEIDPSFGGKTKQEMLNNLHERPRPRC